MYKDMPGSDNAERVTLRGFDEARLIRTAQETRNNGLAAAVISKKPLIIVVKLLVSFSLLAYFFSRSSLGAFAEELRHANTWQLGSAVALLLLQIPLAAWRWQIVLLACGHSAPLVRLQNLIWIGQFANQVTPTFIGGDALRGYYLTKSGVPLAASAGSVIFDRLIGFFGLLLLIAGMAWPILHLLKPSSSGWAIVGGAVIGVSACLFLFILCRLVAPSHLSRLPRALRVVLGETGNFTSHWRPLLSATALAVGTNVLASIAAWNIGEALGLALPMSAYLSLLPVALFLALLPISVAGWGIREGSLVFLLGHLGASVDQAMGLSVCFGACILLAAIPGSLIWVLPRD